MRQWQFKPLQTYVHSILRYYFHIHQNLKIKKHSQDQDKIQEMLEAECL